MYEELASIQGIVDLSSSDALNDAESFLTGLGYRTVRRAGNTLTVIRKSSADMESGDVFTLMVAVQPQPGGGVRIRVRGNDRERMREQQDAWVEWSEKLPRRGTEVADVPLPPPPATESPNLPAPVPVQNVAISEPPSAPPTEVEPPPRGESTVWRGTKLAFGGCVVLPILILVGLVGCVAVVGSFGAFDPAGGGGGFEEPTPEVSSVTVRVSGSPGLRYTGDYGTVDGGQSVEGELGVAPTDYDVPVRSGTFDFDVLSAVFQKQSRQGTLRVEILVDGKVVQARETSAQYGLVDVSYSPQTD